MPNPAAELIIDRWRDGDGRHHCTHCEVCGKLFRTEDLNIHLGQAHLGGKKDHEAHMQAGCDMLVSLAAGLLPDALEAWVKVELRLRDVREWVSRPGTRGAVDGR